MGATWSRAGRALALAAFVWIAGQGAALAEQVGVRAARHEGYVRLVLDWTRAVGYAAGRDGGDVVVTFDRAFVTDFAPVAAALKPLVGKVTLERDGTTVRLHGKAALDAKVFTVGTRVVIDVTRAKAEAQVQEAAAAPAPDEPAEAEPARTEAAKAEPAKAAAAPAAPLPLHKPAPGEAMARLAAALAQDVEFPQAEAVPLPSVPARAAAQPAHDPFWPMLARFVAREGGTQLRFVVNRPVAAAAFVRGERFWIAFDGRFDVAVLSPPSGGAVCADLAPVPSDEGTMLSCAVPVGTGAAVARDGDVWQVTLAADLRRIQGTVGIETDVPGQVVLRVEGATRPLEIPAEDGPILAIPTLAAASGLAREQWFSRYVLLPSAQGIALRRLGPGVEVATAPDAVTLSLDLERAVADAGRYLDPATWPVGPLDEAERLRMLVQTGQGPALSEQRLALMRDLFATGNEVDAAGHWRVLLRQDPEAAARPEARALAGAVALRMGRLDEAAGYLDDPALGGGEAALWRAALDSHRGRYGAVVDGLRAASESWHRMPDPLRAWFGLTLASGLVEAGEPAIADSVLRVGLRGVEETPALRARAAEVVGRIRRANGDLEGAMAAWDEAAAGPDRLASALAREHRVLALLEEGRLAPADAAEELARLSFAWRGDARELERLERLANLYLAAKEHRKALVAMRSIAVNFAGAPDHAEIAHRMGQLFKDIMVGVSAEALSPIAALSVFYEFQELSPIGPDGEAMVEGLAERLAAVDLLDKAGDLLQQQVALRQPGEGRARVGARLAELRLDTGRPGDALEALAASGAEGISAGVIERRRLAQARALGALGRGDEALALLAGDPAPAAVALRADIHWNARNWAAAARELALRADAIEVDAPAPGEPGHGAPEASALGLSPELAETVKRLAVAQSMAGDHAGLAATRARYADEFAGRPDADVFALLAGAPETALPAAWAEIPAALAQTAGLDAFLAAYRSSLSSSGSSALN